VGRREGDAIERLMAADAVVHGLSGPDGPPIVGPAAFKPVFHTFREALGDLEIAVERVLVEGELCTAFCRVKGRQSGAHSVASRPDAPSISTE